MKDQLCPEGLRRWSCAWENKTSEGIVWTWRSSLCYDEQEGGWSLYHNIIIITESWIIGCAAKLVGFGKMRGCRGNERDERPPGSQQHLHSGSADVRYCSWTCTGSGWTYFLLFACTLIVTIGGEGRWEAGKRNEMRGLEEGDSRIHNMAVWWCGVGQWFFCKPTNRWW